MLPLLLYEMHRVGLRPIPPPAARGIPVSMHTNDIGTDRDYDEGLQNVPTQRAHAVHATTSLTFRGERWHCSTSDGYMCHCKRQRAGKDVLEAARAAAGAATWPSIAAAARAAAGAARAEVEAHHAPTHELQRLLAALLAAEAAAGTPAARAAAVALRAAYKEALAAHAAACGAGTAASNRQRAQPKAGTVVLRVHGKDDVYHARLVVDKRMFRVKVDKVYYYLMGHGLFAEALPGQEFQLRRKASGKLTYITVVFMGFEA